jgi:hypothetical protein
MKRNIIDLTGDDKSEDASKAHKSESVCNHDVVRPSNITDTEGRYHGTACARMPSSCFCPYVSWIWARMTDTVETTSAGRAGKWMLFPNSGQVDEAWRSTVELLSSGRLGHCAKVAPVSHVNNGCHLICVYTNDYENIPEVFRVLHALRQLDLPCTKKALHYKTDDATYAGIYNSDSAASRAGFDKAAPKRHKNFKVSMYSSPAVVAGSVVLLRNNVGANFQSVPILEVSLTAPEKDLMLFLDALTTRRDSLLTSPDGDKSSDGSSELLLLGK